MIKIDESIINGTYSSDSGTGRQMPPITEEEQEILEHHGILGMKWGRRKGKSKGKNDSSLSSTVPMTKKSNRVDEGAREKQFINEYNSRDKMSTRSLQNRVKRLQAEQQFRELVNKPAAERAAAAAKIAEKKAKRNKMIMRTALSIYGNVPLASFGKKGKKLADKLGTSQELAVAAAGYIKNSDDISGSLLHAKHKSKLDKRSNMLYEEDVILHGSKIVDSEGLLHGKYKSKHKSKSGKWVYVYEDAKKTADGLFDKKVNETITKTATAKNGQYLSTTDASRKALKKAVNSGRKSDKNYDRSKSMMTSLSKDGSGRTQKISAEFKNIRKKSPTNKGYDSTIRALKGLTK